MSVLQLLFTILVPVIFDYEKRANAVAYGYAFSYLCICVTYIVVFGKLQKTMTQMEEFGDFGTQKRSILRQFFIFCLAMVFKTSLNIFFIVGDSFTDFEKFEFIR